MDESFTETEDDSSETLFSYNLTISKKRISNYEQGSHTHCFNNPDKPCGLQGKHCCLCDIISK